MPSNNRFAAGKYSWGICDICGIRCKYLELKPTTVRGRLTGLRSCPTCWDPDHPQNFLPEYVTADAQALRYARPDTGLEASRQLYPNANWPPYPPPPAAVTATESGTSAGARAAAQRAFRDAREGAEGGKL